MFNQKTTKVNDLNYRYRVLRGLCRAKYADKLPGYLEVKLDRLKVRQTYNHNLIRLKGQSKQGNAWLAARKGNPPIIMGKDGLVHWINRKERAMIRRKRLR